MYIILGYLPDRLSEIEKLMFLSFLRNLKDRIEWQNLPLLDQQKEPGMYIIPVHLPDRLSEIGKLMLLSEPLHVLSKVRSKRKTSWFPSSGQCILCFLSDWLFPRCVRELLERHKYPFRGICKIKKFTGLTFTFTITYFIEHKNADR